MRLPLHFLPLLLVVACSRDPQKVVVVVAPSQSVVVGASAPTAIQSAPPSPASTATTFSIHEGPTLNELLPYAAQVLADGRVLVAGGSYPSQSTALAILDADLRAWRVVRTPDRPAWASPTGVIALDKTFAMAPQAFLGPVSHRGGLLWDPKEEKWTETGALNPNASIGDDVGGASATVLNDGRVLVAGGMVGQRNPLTGTRIWSKDKGSFEDAGDLSVGRVEHTATLLADGRVLVVGGKTGAGRAASIRSAELFDPRAKKWTSAGDLTAARQGHTATLLPDGRVLVAGGNEIVKTPAADMEAWDPTTNKWSIVARMTEPRTHHTATLLPNKRVIFIGGTTVPEDDLGYDTGYTRLTNGEAAITAETWDSSTNRWDPVVIHPPAGRYDHVTALLPDGRLLVIGGTIGTLSKKRLPTEIWEPTQSIKADVIRPITVTLPPSPFKGPTVPIDDGNRIFALGASETWDPGTSSVVAIPNKPRLFPHMALLAPLGGGEILAVDHEHAARFASGVWKEITPSKRFYVQNRAFNGNTDDTTVTALDADRVLFVGGGRAPSLWGAEVWSRVDERFTDAGRPIRPRTRHSATLLDDGRVLVVGGLGVPPPTANPISMRSPRGPILRDGELWDANRKAFSAAGATREARYDHAAVRLADGRVLVTGGRNEAATLKSAEIFSPKTSTWKAAAPMSTVRIAHSATLLADGRILVLGGDMPDVPSTAEIYDPTKNAWTTLGVLPELWTGHQAFLLKDGRVLVATKHRSLVLTLALP